MRRALDDDQVAQARKLRGDGKAYTEIRDALGLDVAPETIRGYCADVPVAGKVFTRSDVARTGRDGRMIRPYTEAEDAAIIAWSTRSLFERMRDAANGVEEETMFALAKRLGRKRHSVAARIATLRKHGKLRSA